MVGDHHPRISRIVIHPYNIRTLYECVPVALCGMNVHFKFRHTTVLSPLFPICILVYHIHNVLSIGESEIQ